MPTVLTADTEYPVSFSGAAKVTACEWNPAAVEALRRNLLDNHCADKCEVLHGDCRQLAPQVCSASGCWCHLVHGIPFDMYVPCIYT
jgi:tRNA G37 N-methylase Trm5